MLRSHRSGNSVEMTKLHKPQLMLRSGSAFRTSLTRTNETNRENIQGDPANDIRITMLEAEARVREINVFAGAFLSPLPLSSSHLR